ncbi:hypothetical protein HZS38_12170 [Xenorhabdus nematophila]|uniref:Uncharacterized protein n=1 Tax=Xenorhabdus nematophila (strain ATCC 19061 / DSM 3370 / CCUG 14189 / LMG 1036 / NCIMB 9965 / AN6) TaxID=406817 RepID=D3VKG3_XENNA|nr:hypothetical protein [Xenorhabdus nematophila]CEF32636.1 hypothetical protein XNW1_4430002 [Xenorhabdus nematophila str. Websteri]MBA0019867.1 hypothetical protein [Xenorhabdus nematophila]QNJ35519.1 hypothetical protein H8F46_12050 [Xenorhabdus nematophila]CBJ88915.1 hypothetical protein XNC1_0844 [Xenorhabdus nematophila ATCC 19061]CCW29020.1 conserved hypothetical protein [Xenorhabdus nematophila F1]
MPFFETQPKNANQALKLVDRGYVHENDHITIGEQLIIKRFVTEIIVMLDHS